MQLLQVVTQVIHQGHGVSLLTISHRLGAGLNQGRKQGMRGQLQEVSRDALDAALRQPAIHKPSVKSTSIWLACTANQAELRNIKEHRD